MIYWRRYNGDYIVFREKDGEYTAEYLNVEFSLFKPPSRDEWVLRFFQKLSDTAGQSGTCGRWPELPQRDEIGYAIERFIDRLNLHQRD